MTQSDAMSYCANQGMHLPSARELAELSASLGAAGISETPKAGYYLVSAINADGKSDKFYFSYAGYKRPAGDLGNNWFWSSSVDSSNSDYAYYLYGINGFVDVFFLDHNKLAVRCVDDRLGKL